MSAFSDAWIHCMRNNNFPVIQAETVGEALEFLDSIHSAMEKAGGDNKLTIGALLAAGAIVGLDETALAVLGKVAKITVVAYLDACNACLGTVAFDELKRLFAVGQVQDFVVAELDRDGIDIKATA